MKWLTGFLVIFKWRFLFPPAQLIAIVFGLMGMLLLISCTPAPGSPPESPTAEQATPINMDDPLVQDARSFAEDQGISLEEALARLEYQQTIGEIQPALEAELADSYGGLWAEHQPEYKIVIALTSGDESTVQSYIEGKPWAEFVEVRRVEHTLAELREAQAAANRAASEINTAVSTGTNVFENRVDLWVGNPDLFLSELATAGLELPDSVMVLAIDPDSPPPETNKETVIEATTADGRTIYLPRQAPTDVSMAALNEGRLVEENGCLRVESQGYVETFLVIWPFDSELRVTGEDIEVLNGDGQIIARVGEIARMGGGAVESSTAIGRVRGAFPGLPDYACRGPVWIAGDLETLAEQAIPDFYISPFSSGSRILALFIEQSRPSEVEGTLSGELTVDGDGCMRVDGHVILWPPRYFLREDPLRIVAEDRTEIAEVGEQIQIEGAEKTSQDYRFFDNKMSCSGPYWGAATAAAAAE